MTEPVPQDTTTHRATVDQLPEELAQELLERIRVRRMATFQVYQETVELKRQAMAERITKDLVKRLAIMEKAIAAADKAVSKAEDQINKVRALRLQLTD